MNVYGLGLRVWGLGFRWVEYFYLSVVHRARCGLTERDVYGLGFGVWGLGFKGLGVFTIPTCVLSTMQGKLDEVGF